VSAKTLFVAEVIRHGARTPLLKGDDYQFEHDTQTLTAAGSKQLFQLGHRLNRKYIKQNEEDIDKLLGSEFVPNEVFIICSTYERTILSAQSQMLGMYPSNKSRQLYQKFMKLPLENYNPQQEDLYFKHLEKIIENDKSGKFSYKALDLSHDNLIGIGQCPSLYTSFMKRTGDIEDCWHRQHHQYHDNILPKVAEAFGGAVGKSPKSHSLFYNFLMLTIL